MTKQQVIQSFRAVWHDWIIDNPQYNNIHLKRSSFKCYVQCLACAGDVPRKATSWTVPF